MTKQCGQKILFPHKNEVQSKSEADLMLTLNKALQKQGVKPKVRFCQIQYTSSRSIFAPFTEKVDVIMLLP